MMTDEQQAERTSTAVTCLEGARRALLDLVQTGTEEGSPRQAWINAIARQVRDLTQEVEDWVELSR